MGRVLIVAHDGVERELLETVLLDEGYQALAVRDTESRAVRAAVTRFSPNCVLLESCDVRDAGAAWETAAWLRRQPRGIPSIMLTTHRTELEEARAGVTARSRTAALVAALEKPFALEDLLVAVAEAVVQHAEAAHDMSASGRGKLVVKPSQLQ
jgi:CheY-like chemotaxis protein